MKSITRFLVCTLGIAILATGCYRQEMDALKEQLDSFKNTSIDPLSEQLKKVEESLSVLESTHSALDETVKGLDAAKKELDAKLSEADAKLKALSTQQGDDIKALRKELEELRDSLLEKLKVVNAAIDELKEKDKALDARITEIKAFLDNKLTDVYAEFTKTADIIAGIQASIQALTASITNIDSTLSARIEEINSSLSGKIKTAASEVTTAYENAISQAKTNILFEIDEKIEKAIAGSKETILKWVNEELLVSYYNSAMIDGLIEVLRKADTALLYDIQDLRRELSDAKTALESAILQAIKDAKIDEKIEAAIKSVAPDIEQLKKDTQKCLDDISSLTTRVVALEQQATKMEEAIAKLKEVDAKLNAFIEALQKTSEQLQKDLEAAQKDIVDITDSLGNQRAAISAIQSNIVLINARIAELKEADSKINERITALAKQIDAIRSNVDTQIKETREWAEKTFVTLTEYGETVKLVNKIDENVAALGKRLTEVKEELSKSISNLDNKVMEALTKAEQDITKAYTEDIKYSIDTLNTSIKNWVNAKLEKEYYTAATIENKLSVLKKAYEKTDSLHSAQIEQLQKDLAALEGKIESTCETCINEAIAKDGVIDTFVSSKLSELNTEMQTKFDGINEKITALTGRIETLETKIGSCETQITNIKNSLKDLRAMDSTITVWINSIKAVIGQVPEEYKSTIMADLKALFAADEALQKGIKDLEKSLKKGGDIATTIQGWIDETLENYYTKTKIDALIEAVDAAVKKADTDLSALAEKVSALETLTGEGGAIRKAIADVKADCEKLLEGYYTKAQIDSKFDNYYQKASLYTKTEIDEMLKSYYKQTDAQQYVQDQLDILANGSTVATAKDLEDKLKAAKEEMENSYKKYIEDAIKNDDGVIKTAIQSAIDALRGGYDKTLQDLKNDIDQLLANVSTLKNVVQSVVFVPDTEDGKVVINFGYDPTSPERIVESNALRFRLNTVNDKFDYTKYTYSGNVVYTKTKAAAAGDVTTLQVSSKEYDAQSKILTVKFSASTLDDNFFNTNLGASISLNISDGTTNVSSEYVAFVANQTSQKPKLYLNVYKVEIEDFHGGDTYNKTVDVHSEGDWTISQKSDWIIIKDDKGNTVTGNTVGEANANLRIYVSAEQHNGTEQRSGNVKIVSGTESQDLTVTQAARPAQEFNPISSSITMEFNDLTPHGLPVSAKDGETDWEFEPATDANFTIEKIVNGTFDKQEGFTGLVITAKAINDNNSSTKRTVTVKIKPKTGGAASECVVTQNGRNAQVLTVTPEAAQEVPWEAGTDKKTTVKYTVRSNDGMTDWTVACSGTGSTVSAATDNKDGSYSYDVTVPDNSKAETAAYTVTFTPSTIAGGTAVERTINQAARPAQTLTYDFADNAIAVDWKGNAPDGKVINVTACSDKRNDWKVEQDATSKAAGWFTVNTDKDAPTYTNGKGKITIIVNKMDVYTNNADRNGTVTITPAAGGTPKVITVSQTKRDAQTLTYSPDTESITVDWKGNSSSPYVIEITSSSDKMNDWKVEQTSGTATWLSVVKSTEGYSDGKGKITISAGKLDFKTANNDRTSDITVTPAGGTPKVFKFKQTKRPDQKLTISPDAGTKTVKWDGTETYDITVTPDDKEGDWTVAAQDDSQSSKVITYSLKSDNGNGSRTYTVSMAKFASKGSLSYENDKCTLSRWIKFQSATGTSNDKQVTISQTRDKPKFSPTKYHDGHNFLQSVKTANWDYYWYYSDVVSPIDPGSNDGDWTAGTTTVTGSPSLTASKDSNNKLAISSPSVSRSDDSYTTACATVTLTSNFDSDVKISYNYWQLREHRFSQFATTSGKDTEIGTITFPAMGEGYTIKCTSTSQFTRQEYSMTFNNKTYSSTKVNIDKLSVKVGTKDITSEAVSCADAVTIQVTGVKGDNSGSGSTKRYLMLTFTITDIDGKTFNAGFRLNFGKKSATISSIDSM